jgi:hypothetical protein
MWVIHGYTTQHWDKTIKFFVREFFLLHGQPENSEVEVQKRTPLDHSWVLFPRKFGNKITALNNKHQQRLAMIFDK